MFKPLIDSLFDAMPLLWDKWGDFVYRLIEGRPYSDEAIDIDESDKLIIDNIVKYEYVPLIDEKGIFNIFKIKDKYVYQYIEGDKAGLKVCIGIDTQGNYVWLDMCNSHLLVGGMARWGKSSVINTIITSYMLTYTPNEVRFLFCDYKVSDVKFFDRYKHSIGNCSTNKEQFLAQLKWLEKEGEKRAIELHKSGWRNIIKYNEKSETKMSYIIFVIDELPQVTQDNTCMEKLHLVMSRYAYAGFYFICATQDCSKNVIGRMKMNCSQTIGFHTRDKTDSDLLMPNASLEDIRIKGRCKFDGNGDIVELQSFYLEEEEIEELLKYNLKE